MIVRPAIQQKHPTKTSNKKHMPSFKTGAVFSEDFVSVLSLDFGEDPLARNVVAEFLSVRGYRREFAERLIAVAAGTQGASWELRRACVLMLENQFLRLRTSDEREQDWLLSRIGARADRSLRKRLERLARVHRGIRGRRTTPVALADFLHVARQECKLSLARYFFRAGEVAARIARQVRFSQGLLQWTSDNDPEYPRYEQRIVSQLRQDSAIYWTACRTPAQINSLVECPLGTVALTLKLPGSDMEFEIKRSGIRSRHPLDVRVLGYTYRLYGGSQGGSTRQEARSAARLAELYSRVHEEAPPMSVSRAIFSIQSVPAWQGDAHLLDYFTDRRIFGNGYRQMRKNMEATVLGLEPDGPGIDLHGALGLTVRFLRRMPPHQAWLENSTSFRLDVLERYLLPDGPEQYFVHGLGRNFTRDEARRLADDLLEEILGVYTPPADSGGDTGGTYQEYVERAFAVPANRRRADRIYIALMRQAGRFFGTLLAPWGGSYGESFVRRNVGLKNRWRNGSWKPEIIFMDHDTLWVPGEAEGDFDPKISLEASRLDTMFFFAEEARPEQARGSVRTLHRIYRISEPLKAKGEIAFRRASVQAYRKTRRGMVLTPKVREFFSPDVIAKIADWESVAWDCVQARRAGLAPGSWESQTRAQLHAKGYSAEVAEKWLGAANGHARLLENYSAMFDPRYLAFKRSNKQSGG
jgi:hypothetical protein